MTTREKVLELHAAGRRPKQIRHELGLGIETIYAALRPARELREGDLDPETWRAFLDAHLDRTTGYELNRQDLTKTDIRKVYDWLRFLRPIDFWTADRFLTPFYMHVDDFFQWAEEQGLEAWGERPGWEI